ncbi:MAG: methylmalonyl-CoA mutase family protein [Deltaproteobacteria bacterium]|nr:methylmalonyl-CoA mutase family protein [Deltaproteobacteria bacterium]
MSDATNKGRRQWEEQVLEPLVAKRPERQELFETPSESEVDRLYDPDSLGSDWRYEDQLGYPGTYPFTRGVQPTMYRGRLWTMRQYAGFATAEETNARYKYLLEQGQTGLSVAFDLPTQMGYDSDHVLAKGEVGRTGVSISSLADFEVLMDGLPLDRISTSMTINSTASSLLAMYLTLADRQSVPRDKVRGTIQNDILKEYVARGTYIFPVQPSMRIITDIFSFCRSELPRWNPISISGYHIREAGSTAVQEVAFTLANGIAYVDAALKAGLEVDAFAGRLSFFFASHNNILEEVAKFRAARRLWAKIVKERFGAKKDRSCALRFHTQTCGHTLTAQQPDNNVVRVAYQALAAVLGGTQSLHTNSRDEAFALPTKESVTIALRTQQILAHESGVADTIDPFAGSYVVEAMTDRIEREAEAYIEKIDSLGGAARSIEAGFMQDEIATAAYRTQKAIESGRRIVVGVNKFQAEEDKGPLKTLRIDSGVEEGQVKRLADLRAGRDNEKVSATLGRLQDVARGDENVMPAIIEAVQAYATIGEISDSLREVYGVYRPA